MHIPSFVIPARIGRAVARLPQSPPTFALVAALNLGLGRLVPRETLEPLLGKRLMLTVTDAGLSLRFTLGSSGFLPAYYRDEPDLRVAATVRDLIALALREEDPDTLFFARRLLLEGDTSLGLLVKNTLDQIDWPNADLGRLAPRRLVERFLFSGTTRT